MTTTPVRRAYVRAARVAADLLGHPAVAASWDEPSALRHYRVSGLAGHLAGQVTFAGKALDAPGSELRPIPILDYYDRVAWMTPDHDSGAHIRIRHGSALLAEGGAAALAARTDAEASRLPDLLAAVPAPRRVRLPSWEWTLTMDDFLLTRLVELTVHVDDLATSVKLPTPPFPTDVTRPVLDLLTDLAVRRHGQVAVLRALTRTERAPTTISVFA
ncbi:maleylpyruvate isomerase N-terminal domain-containing protein [Virgisporangium aurantiacum]|uniref:Mycothiol-dependent maleylpyruvate isomerase metal-binding domain-containing protein n=1 Tax=Virgisporangium aurantiacum TaxID=175570 RepID=A0A8J4E3V2_9ACTN|nr:maleylpyruvate isomerase N-terminal domain-containing protein [Virgisporangium aurantiacum]GIJ61285.1 hypothetical protein Vau01_088010 [Virgisporangium aurantiacum]